MSTRDESSFLENSIIPILQNLNLYIDDEPLDYKYLQLLKFFLRYPCKTAKEVKDASLEGLNEYDYNTIHRHINHLCVKLKLIEVERQELVKNMKSKYIKYYRLSLNGILYVVLNINDFSSGDLVLTIMRNYKHNVIFTRFLYPFIKEQTLEDLTEGWDSDIFSNISLYLKDICNAIVKAIRDLGTNDFTTPDGYIINRVFVYSKNQNQPLSSLSYYGLQYFLNKAFNWDWIYRAQILSKNEENTIEIRDPYNPKNNSNITIIRDEKNAVLRQNGKKVYVFSVHIDNSLLSIGVKTNRKRIDSLELSVVDICRTHLLTFLTKIRETSPYNVTFDILYQDENLKKALEYMDLKPMLKDNLL